MLNVTRKTIYEGIKEADIQIGDQVAIPVEGFGTFTATAEKVTNDSVLFIFDDIVVMLPMNTTDINEGGFKDSQLYKWLRNTLLPAFPECLRSMISELTIPTVGQIVGHENEWNNEHLEGDNDKQLPLMKDRKHRIALFEGESSWYWAQNATKKDYSASYFACVAGNGRAYYGSASASLGVRPVFWLVKDKSRDPVPRGGRKRYYNGSCREVTRESLIEEINEKASEIDALKKKIEKLEKKNQCDEAATGIKATMDSLVRAGFTEEQAFDMVKTMLASTIGGTR